MFMSGMFSFWWIWMASDSRPLSVGLLSVLALKRISVISQFIWWLVFFT
jgi:hypothetical protein